MEHFWREISDVSFNEHINIQVYQTNFQGAKLKALDGNFPMTKKFLGSSLFQAISKHFIKHADSVNDSLNAYGKEFPMFLQELIPHNPSLKNKNFLVDIANLDWANIQSYFAADDDPNINWANNKQSSKSYLALANHVHAVSFHHIDLTIFKNIHFESLHAGMPSKSLLTHLVEPLELNQNITQLLIYRRDFEVQVMLLNELEHDFFLLLQARTPLFALDELLLKKHTPEQVVRLVNKFKNAGILIGIREPDHE